MEKKQSINNHRLPEKGDTGGVDPAGETGGDPFWFPGGFIIMMLRVILFASEDESPPYDLAFPPSDSDQDQSKEIPRQIFKKAQQISAVGSKQDPFYMLPPPFTSVVL
jgi:hypothetical protein